MISASKGVNFELDRPPPDNPSDSIFATAMALSEDQRLNFDRRGIYGKAGKGCAATNPVAETDLMTLRIHCYAPGIGENALHSHTKEDHVFLVLQGTAQFNTGRDGQTIVRAGKNTAVVLPAGCYYQFCNSGTEPLVMARIGAGQDKADQRLNPDGTAIPGRTHEQGAAKPVLIEGAFFE